MPRRILYEYEKEFARFVLEYSGEDEKLDTVIEDCARFDMSVKEYFIDNLVNHKYYTKEDAEEQVQEWSLEYEENNLPDDPTQGKPQMKAIEWIIFFFLVVIGLFAVYIGIIKIIGLFRNGW